jgi:hypothetical protein
MQGVTLQTNLKGSDMPDFPADLKNAVSTWRQKREPTKLECGMLGALTATIALGLLFWLGVQLSILRLIVEIT